MTNIRNKSNILVIGDLILDQFIDGISSRLSPEAPVPIINVNSYSESLGGAGNVARNLISLGNNVKLFGVLGKNNASKTFISLCITEKIDTKYIQCIDNYQTIIKSRVIANNKQICRLDQEEIKDVNIEIPAELFQDIDACIISDYGKGLINSFTMKQIKKYCKAPLIIDPKPKNKNLYMNCDYITPNYNEILQMVTENGYFNAANQLKYDLQCNGVLLTLSEDGIMLVTKDGTEHFIESTKQISDVAGAGDTVIATFVHYLCRSYSPSKCAELANKAGSIVVGKKGIVPIKLEDLEKCH